jgi:UDP-4-amino-4-deoxy-L-arabinose-oxoglutarate aminotransferase
VLVDKRDEFMAKLKDENIGSGLHFEAVHRTSLYKKGAKKLPQTDYVCSRICSLPLFVGMTDQDADDVIAAVRKVLA